MDQQGSPCCHIFLTVTSSYHNKVTSISALQAEQIDEAVLIYVSMYQLPSFEPFIPHSPNVLLLNPYILTSLILYLILDNTIIISTEANI